MNKKSSCQLFAYGALARSPGRFPLHSVETVENIMAMQTVFKALSDPIRREILQLLKKKPQSAGEIAQNFSISFPAISRHLSVLKEADMVRDHREGKQIVYELNTSILEDVLLWVQDLQSSSRKESES